MIIPPKARYDFCSTSSRRTHCLMPNSIESYRNDSRIRVWFFIIFLLKFSIRWRTYIGVDVALVFAGIFAGFFLVKLPRLNGEASVAVSFKIGSRFEFSTLKFAIKINSSHEVISPQKKNDNRCFIQCNNHHRIEYIPFGGTNAHQRHRLLYSHACESMRCVSNRNIHYDGRI